MNIEEIKEGQYLYYTDLKLGISRFGNQSGLFHVYKTGEALMAELICLNIGTRWINVPPEKSGSCASIRSLFDEHCWFLTDFPGGDAAEWMSRNYPLDESGF